jgi:predicted  nucleic acid-binding Zn-ribbon protein
MIPIYKYELDNGLDQIIQTNASIAYVSTIQPIKIDQDKKLELQTFLNSSASANPNQFDLYYLESILASVGWNNNDDVFDRFELWKARNTPVDKQFNFMHNEKDIIGHLTSSKLVDLHGKIILEDTPFDLLPDVFDIVVGSVLYKRWSDQTLQERMSKIIEEIEQDKWCVSMECLFKNFDYAIKKDDGFNKVLARNDETSFLTKHLRIYGGTGEYDGYKIGRLIKGFTFSGKGLVDNPANPRSHITNFNKLSEKSSFVAAATTLKELKISNEEKKMANELVYTQEQYNALKAELDHFKSVSETATKNEIDSLKAEISQLNDKVKQLSFELEASKEVSNAKEEKVLSLQKELDNTKVALADKEKSIKEAEIKALKALRRSILLERVDEEKADVLVQKFAEASQDMFDALVESLPKKSEAIVEETIDDTTDVVTNIDNANAEEVTMSSGNTSEEDSLIEKASAWLMSSVLRNTPQNKE